jgi:hypothetical protein
MDSGYYIFSQSQLDQPNEFQIVAKAKQFFRAELQFVHRHWHERPFPHHTFELELQLSTNLPVRATALLRSATENDYQQAMVAEQLGKAGGMASLARRCPSVWELPAGELTPYNSLILCGILAASLLGPVMPHDGSTLFGVRGARERAERLLTNTLSG